MSADCPHCRRFREERDEALEALRQAQLDGDSLVERVHLAIKGLDPKPAPRAGTRAHAAILAALLLKDVVPTPVLAEKCSDAESSVNILRQHICRLRPVLARFGIEIVVVQRTGYALPPASKQRLRELMNAVSE